jgi:hypothetical protein
VNRIQQQTEQTTKIKPFVIEESLPKNKQHSYKAKKQEVEQQEHKTVQDQEKHKGIKL